MVLILIELDRLDFDSSKYPCRFERLSLDNTCFLSTDYNSSASCGQTTPTLQTVERRITEHIEAISTHRDLYNLNNCCNRFQYSIPDIKLQIWAHIQLDSIGIDIKSSSDKYLGGGVGLWGVGRDNPCSAKVTGVISEISVAVEGKSITISKIIISFILAFSYGHYTNINQEIPTNNFL